MAYEVFISCSKQDQPLRQKLDNHLANLKRQNIIPSVTMGYHNWNKLVNAGYAASFEATAINTITYRLTM